MNNLVTKSLNLKIDEIDEFKFPLDEPFALKINNEGVIYDFIIRFSSKNKNLICCASGAHSRDQRTSTGELIKPPYFDRWSWYKYFEESFIAFSDPIFYYNDEITLGWCVGDKNQWYLEVISKIISKLAQNQKIINDNILFFSSSGGGFVSVGLATLLRNSKCLINNSQFSVFNYYQKHITNLFKILKKEFNGLTESEISESIIHRLDLIELFKKEKYMPDITYYVNVCSDDDIDNHCIPFVNDVLELPYFKNNLNVCFYHEDKAKPHHALETNKTLKILKNFIKGELYNDE